MKPNLDINVFGKVCLKRLARVDDVNAAMKRCGKPLLRCALYKADYIKIEEELTRKTDNRQSLKTHLYHGIELYRAD